MSSFVRIILVATTAIVSQDTHSQARKEMLTFHMYCSTGPPRRLAELGSPALHRGRSALKRGQVRSGQVRLRQVASGQVRSGQVGQVSSLGSATRFMWMRPSMIAYTGVERRTCKGTNVVIETIACSENPVLFHSISLSLSQRRAQRMPSMRISKLVGVHRCQSHRTGLTSELIGTWKEMERR